MLFTGAFPKLFQVKWIRMIAEVCKISNHRTTAFDRSQCPVLFDFQGLKTVDPWN